RYRAGRNRRGTPGSVLVAADQYLLEVIGGRGDKRQRSLELVDVDVGQRDRVAERQQVAELAQPTADGVADGVQRFVQIDAGDRADRGLDLHPVLTTAHEREVPEHHYLRAETTD